MKYLGTARGRLGWLPTETILLYGTAGLARERFERGMTEVITGAPGSVTGRSVSPLDQFGWVAGAGAEVMLGSSNWIGRLEYLHYDFGRVNADGTFASSQPGMSVSAALTAGRQTIDVVRAGASYKFGPELAAPAAAPAMYTKGPRMPVPLQSWAGFYFGAHAGYGWTTISRLTSSTTHSLAASAPRLARRRPRLQLAIWPRGRRPGARRQRHRHQGQFASGNV